MLKLQSHKFSSKPSELVTHFLRACDVSATLRLLNTVTTVKPLTPLPLHLTKEVDVFFIEFEGVQI